MIARKLLDSLRARPIRGWLAWALGTAAYVAAVVILHRLK